MEKSLFYSYTVNCKVTTDHKLCITSLTIGLKPLGIKQSFTKYTCNNIAIYRHFFTFTIYFLSLNMMPFS